MKNCPRCQNKFTCGSEAGTATCWCFDMPALINIQDIKFPGEPGYEDCLCPDCLRELIAANASNTAADSSGTSA
ncbi:MAG: cysteine-rich CWC family protein [Chloroflexi bacterium]|nr:cysteine-rich CWC family protein [Chloroflexota bacterium]